MTSEGTIKAHARAKATDHESKENLPFWLAVILHLLPGALLVGMALILARPLIDRDVPYELVHIASALLTIVPFIFGAMLLYGRTRYGHFSLREVVRFRRPMPIWQYAALYVPMLAFAFAIVFVTQPLGSFLAERVFFWQPYNWPLIFLLVLVEAYVVWWKRNIYISMLLHCSGNTIGAALALLAFFTGRTW